uniref:Uncharacterized protein n=1 Tax=Arundo donax TaxID=35708 RepID=A0A0A9FTJ0_ARUDO
MSNQRCGSPQNKFGRSKVQEFHRNRTGISQESVQFHRKNTGFGKFSRNPNEALVANTSTA